MSPRATTLSGGGQDETTRITTDYTTLVWLGAAAPARSIRWLDGAIAAAAKFGEARAIAFAAGAQGWLDLVADRASRAQIACAGVATELALDYLGWAQIVAAAARHLRTPTILVDEASRADRAPEVAAIAELVDAPQLTRVVKLAPDGAVVHCSRSLGRDLQTVRVTLPAVIGVRVPGPAIGEYPTPVPSATMKRLELVQLGLDPGVLAHRTANVPRAGALVRKTAERIADLIAPRGEPGGGA